MLVFRRVLVLDWLERGNRLEGQLGNLAPFDADLTLHRLVVFRIVKCAATVTQLGNFPAIRFGASKAFFAFAMPTIAPENIAQELIRADSITNAMVKLCG